MYQFIFHFTKIVRKCLYILLGTIDRVRGNQFLPVFVLNYHSIDTDKWDFSVTPDDFMRQIEYLKNFCYFISISDLEKFIRGTQQVSTPAVAITFDDGYENIIKVRKYLNDNSIKPTVFIIASDTDINYDELETRNRLLSKTDISSLMKDGWEIGSHSSTHSNLTQQDNRTLEYEIESSKKTLENKLHTKIKYFAYPKGKYTKSVVDMVRQSGYTIAMSMDDGVINSQTDSYAIPRIGVDGTHSFAEFKYLASPLVSIARKIIKGLGYVA